MIDCDERSISEKVSVVTSAFSAVRAVSLYHVRKSFTNVCYISKDGKFLEMARSIVERIAGHASQVPLGKYLNERSA